MFQTIRVNNHRLDVVFSGKLDSASMKVALDEMIQQAHGITDGAMLVKVGEFELPTLGAMGVEMSRLPQLFRFIRQFDRVAVVAGQTWVRKMSTVEGALIPGLNLQAFALDETAEAEAWLAR
ncbi:STAS/SEC14 domain-containing protein [Pseudomonas sp. OIL-1]|uniref:STAS/SEC14 domain-containing protein n=1 Tax=Pseudomonas sp. OIL-1 TaxID=2706126 RepID=UPI0013A76048|nr:STAS/SEC14 domain-containing protein [Pseudomonas sp. OIL-1]QIB49846.1 STAS/SEC14 domain-containing protein [Pseudomonas sp. OIL-1]